MHLGEREVWWGPRGGGGGYRAIEGEDRIVKYPEERAGELAIWKHMGPWAYDDPLWKPEDDLKYQEAQQEAEDKARAQTDGADGEGQHMAAGTPERDDGPS